MIDQSVLNLLENQKQLSENQGIVKKIEPNMVIETKQEVIDTVAKKDFSKENVIQSNQCVSCPRSMFFVIKKGDPIQVIKTIQKGTLQNDIFYSLKKHDGRDYAMTIEEENKIAIKRQFGFTGNFGVFSYYNLPKEVVEEQTIVGKLKDIASVNPYDTLKKNRNKNIVKVGLIALVGYVVYKLVSEDKV